MKGVKGTAKGIGDPCAMCALALTEENVVWRRGRPGALSYCRQCLNLRSRTADKAKRRATSRRHSRKLRATVIEGYGGACACCGEARPEFLAIDHVAGGGSQHRKTVTSPTEMCRLVIREGFPAKFQLLCHNCNSAKGWYGQCPHERERNAADDRTV